MPSRILILSTSYLPLIGGSELAIRHITDRLLDFNFDLITGRYQDGAPLSETIGRVRVFRAGGRWARWSVLLPKALLPLAIAITALRLMRSHRYAGIHVYQASQAGAAGLLVKLFHPRTPLILTLQEGKDLTAQSLLTRWVRYCILRSANHITAISSYLAQYARQHSAVPVSLIPNGVDVAVLAPKEARQSAHTIISVSRLVEKNGVEQLIRAMPQIQNKFSDAKLVLVGDGPLRHALEELSTALGVSVEFVGSVPHEDLPRHLQAADVFARPSRSEGLGNAFLEAMAAEVPVVGSAVGGITDFLRHEDTGLICEPENPHDIAHQIIRLFDEPQLRAQIIARAATLAREKYDWNGIARQMGQLYAKVFIA
jgi:glycosyltransferase involved in cell wall biosynthesis